MNKEVDLSESDRLVTNFDQQARTQELLEIFKDNTEIVSGCVTKVNEQDLVYRLEKRAEIRRQISTRKSVEEGKPDRISDLLEEAADEIKRLRDKVKVMEWRIE